MINTKYHCIWSTCTLHIWKQIFLSNMYTKSM